MNEKRRSAAVITFFFLICAFGIFSRPIGNMDELWNYGFAKNIAGGGAPYRDFNLVVTPLSAVVSGGFLWLFGDSLFVFRILELLLSVTLAAVF